VLAELSGGLVACHLYDDVTGASTLDEAVSAASVGRTA